MLDDVCNIIYGSRISKFSISKSFLFIEVVFVHFSVMRQADKREVFSASRTSLILRDSFKTLVLTTLHIYDR